MLEQQQQYEELVSYAGTTQKVTPDLPEEQEHWEDFTLILSLAFSIMSPYFRVPLAGRENPWSYIAWNHRKCAEQKRKYAEQKFKAKALILLKHTKSLKSKILHSKDKFLLLSSCHWSGNLNFKLWLMAFLNYFQAFVDPPKAKTPTCLVTL